MAARLRWPEPPPAARRWLSEPGGPIAPPASTSKLHDDRIAARLGIALAATFSICFLTGLWSHVQQDPPTWLAIPSRPAGLYRVTQGLHVITGLASIPLLLAKLWAVWPRFFQWPAFRTVVEGLWRLALLPLVGGSLFLLGTGTANIAGWYPWTFDFRKAHFAAAWLTMGGLLVHVAAVSGVAAAALRQKLKDGDATDGRLSRRGFLGVVGAAAGAVTLTTAGATVRPLRALSVLATRDPNSGPQGLPVNRSAVDAGTRDVDLAAFRLRVQGRVATPLELTYEEVLAMATHTATLPITCVEGWSAAARWRGVPVRALLQRAGAEPGAEVVLTSLEQRGAYRTSALGHDHAADPDTLLATHLDGQPLAPDHGFPLRLIAPNRPGVLQTKWVTTVEVR
ncbi:MAG: molybdopterin-dependent oxidoreductase [Acidimicrobiales bacterium]